MLSPTLLAVARADAADTAVGMGQTIRPRHPYASETFDCLNLLPCIKRIAFRILQSPRPLTRLGIESKQNQHRRVGIASVFAFGDRDPACVVLGTLRLFFWHRDRRIHRAVGAKTQIARGQIASFLSHSAVCGDQQSKSPAPWDGTGRPSPAAHPLPFLLHHCQKGVDFGRLTLTVADESVIGFRIHRNDGHGQRGRPEQLRRRAKRNQFIARAK